MALTSYSGNHVLWPQKSLACDPQLLAASRPIYRLVVAFLDNRDIGYDHHPRKSTQCLPAIIAIETDPAEITIRARARAPQTEVTDTKDITIGTVMVIADTETTVMIAIGTRNQPLRCP
ncbi:hypothetical protein Aspvir_005496 [Aspergillus viridinutans]|uniref:Uncharacterized protein n=1 Tax=Aspergillus viridinutans TaxID=75553 RepID=A0A9P3BRG8_ASPVI|nr:uncharacterized protein Aspvir_005496 [Aspergillus viridinutans]GIK01460.1 hypothetical protein Aspvir_005496 [Aspergillus viridinutans]